MVALDIGPGSFEHTLPFMQSHGASSGNKHKWAATTEMGETGLLL